MSPAAFVLDVLVDGAWLRACCDGVQVTFATRSEAETEARWSFDDSAEWRVVEIEVAS